MALQKDLIVIVPDGAILNVVQTLLGERHRSLQIRELSFEVRKDPLHDASPETKAVDILRGYLRSHKRAMVMRDLAGSGWEMRGANALEGKLTHALLANGWTMERVVAIVIEPEIEAWLRLGSTHLRKLVEERARRNTDLAGLLFSQQVQKAIEGSGGESKGKPDRPKEAFEGLLEEFGIPRSNALYRELARHESLEGCVIPSFRRFVDSLHRWFATAT